MCTTTVTGSIEIRPVIPQDLFNSETVQAVLADVADRIEVIRTPDHTVEYTEIVPASDEDCVDELQLAVQKVVDVLGDAFAYGHYIQAYDATEQWRVRVDENHTAVVDEPHIVYPGDGAVVRPHEGLVILTEVLAQWAGVDADTLTAEVITKLAEAIPHSPIPDAMHALTAAITASEQPQHT
ncbi:hypothetical protein AB0H83_45810 [Dactylosporangium sp. NPDC050688]|uniref:hypothetical protein n=1 Tax=Dactylosporangium sp. NPDC050688 TaxID=3157217 RepID=UPI0033C59765